MIYLLEDDDSIRKLVVYGLQSQGYEAQGFALPSAFWKAMEKAAPELVLLDLMDRFLANEQALRAQYFEERGVFPRAGAFWLTASGRTADAAALRDAAALCAAVDSRFDGMSAQVRPLLAAACAGEEPEPLLLRTGGAYRALREAFPPSPQLIPPALLLARRCPDEADFDETVRRVKALFDALGSAHPVLTGFEDLGACALLALSGQDMSRKSQLYLLDEPIGGVDPATRDYILQTIIGNYDEKATVVISTHLITDVEPVLDEVVFLKNGTVYLHEPADALREKTGKSVDALFREVFKC